MLGISQWQLLQLLLFELYLTFCSIMCVTDMQHIYINTTKVSLIKKYNITVLRSSGKKEKKTKQEKTIKVKNKAF